jgi:putative hydrolase of the HAD superfamily
MKYKHYSFDLWLTLIKSHPEFKRKRAEYFYNLYNPQNKTIDEIEKIIREVDIMGTITNERVGKNIHPFELLSFVLLKLENSSFRFEDLNKIYKVVEKLFFEYHPQFMTSETLEIIYELWNKGATLSILSNTGFITGKTLRQVLHNLKISHYTKFDIFSDEVGLSKPNVKIFEIMIEKTKQLHNGYILNHQIVHVGDNDYADFKGAMWSGIGAIHIKNGNLKPLIENEEQILSH